MATKRVHVSESYTSLILGMLVVALVAILAIGFMRSRNASRLQTAQPEISSQRTEERIEEKSAKEKNSVLNTHKVIEGETLWSIAQMYYKTGDRLTLIAKVNNLSNPDLLEAGVTLTIPKVEAQKDAISGSTYTVKENDTLWDIALRAYGDGFRWVEVAKVNNLANPDIIHAGNVLKIPR